MRQESILVALLIGTLAFSVIGAAQAAPQPAKGAFAGVVWTGASNTDWQTSANWSGGAVPGATDDVIIDVVTGTNHPTINLASGAVTIKSLTIGTTTNATLTFKNSLATDVNRRLRVTGNVTVGANGSLTHALEAFGAGQETQQLHLDVGGNLTIAASGRIDVARCGYDSGPGAAINNNHGASHGGQGGDTQRKGAIYGSVTNPVSSGSGYANNARGGGTVKLTITGGLALNGSITADGGPSHEAAAGGSVNITAGTLTGSGTVSANGGTPGGGGGGGGRVAIVLTGAGADASYAAFAGKTIRAYGGANTGSQYANQFGAAGTVYLKGNDTPNGRLIVDNNNASFNNTTTLASTLLQNQSLLVDRIEVRNYGRLALGAGCILDLSQGCVLTSDSTSRFIVDSSGNPTIQWPASFTLGGAATPCTLSWSGTSEYTINCASLTVATNGVLTHEPLSPSSGEPVSDGGPWAASTVSFSYDQRLCAKIQGNLTVQPGGKIDVSGCGYKGGPCPGINNSRGGSHGGQGGSSPDLPYGSVTDPELSGSGGYGGDKPIIGGGAVKLTITGGFALNGAITADGRSAHEGAAGGSVNITAGTLTGDGIISANGGNGGGRGGGGGRVAMGLTSAADTAFDRLTITAYGGTKGGGEAGSAGTVYLKGAHTAYGNLIVDNKPNPGTTRCTQITLRTGDLTVNNLVKRNHGRLGFDAVSRKVTVYGNWLNDTAPDTVSDSDLTPGGVATVVLAGDAPATVTGSNLWYNLAITNANKVVTFQDGATQTLDATGTLLLGKDVKLRTASGAPFAFAKGPPRGLDGMLRDKAPDYTVRVQGKEVDTYAFWPTGAHTSPSSFGTCDMDKPVTVEVVVNWLDPAKIGGVSIHPLSRGIQPQREGSRITFQVDRPGSLTLKINGDYNQNPLHLFFCPPVKPPPPDAIVFGPGRHVVGPEKAIELKSGQTLYLAPGSWVEGFVRASNATNISIMGRGVLSQRLALPGKKNWQGYPDSPSGIAFVNCTNVLIEGIVVTRQHVNWNIIPINCDGVTVRDVHVVAPFGVSTDGCNPQNCRNVLIDRCFFRCNDDNVAIGGQVPNGLPNENILVTNTVFWGGQGRVLYFAMNDKVKCFRNIQVRDCDVLFGNKVELVQSQAGEMQDILFENIRFEDNKINPFFRIGFFANDGDGVSGDLSRPGVMRGVTLRNITITQQKGTPRSSVIQGMGADKLVENVTIENLRFIGPEGKK